MLKIPYETNPGKACALACHTMTARYFFSEMTFDQIAKICDWEPGHVVWAFKFWLWIMDRGVKVTGYDPIDLKVWAEEGVEGLKKMVSQEEFEFCVKNTKDIEGYSDDIKKVLAHKNFNHHSRRPKWSDLVDAYDVGGVCEVVLNPCALDEKEGFELHRVVVLDVDDEHVVFHDPRKNKFLPERKESVDLFKKAWLESVEGPELCVYERE